LEENLEDPLRTLPEDNFGGHSSRKRLEKYLEDTPREKTGGHRLRHLEDTAGGNTYCRGHPWSTHLEDTLELHRLKTPLEYTP
jgi:hypothetical protein